MKYINTVCFVRTYDYYGNYDPKNLVSLKEQMKLYNRLGLPATYLLEYDALEREAFREAIYQNSKLSDELGAWFEVTGGLCEAAGVEWRSRRDRDWDFYVDPGFVMSYTLEEKERLCDALMGQFKSCFGAYPRTVGAWLLDSDTMEYLNRRYGMDAYIICREQWGMDGYTLWGGPYFGGYYPSRGNMLTPAQKRDEQLFVPVFRMYVSDPIYSYYEFSHGELSGIDYHLFSQEPYWKCGQTPGWVRWCFETLFGEDRRGFYYYQLGQETGFGYGKPLSDALAMQCEYALANRERYDYVFATVSEMGRDFRKIYRSTPENFVAALTDWAQEAEGQPRENQSVWYNSARYRVNVYVRGQELRFRDIHLFDDSYTDRYCKDPCRKQWAVYDNLPVVDGVRFTEGCDEGEIPFDNDFSGRRYGEAAGLYLAEPARITGAGEREDGRFCVELNGGAYEIVFYPERIEIEKHAGKWEPAFSLRFRHKENLPYMIEKKRKEIRYRHRDFTYSMVLKAGKIAEDRIWSQERKIIVSFKA